MKKLLIILIILSACSIEQEDDYISECDCRIKIEKVTVVNNGGIYSTKIVTTYRDYDATNCILDGNVIFSSNIEVKTIICE